MPRQYLIRRPSDAVMIPEEGRFAPDTWEVRYRQAGYAPPSGSFLAGEYPTERSARAAAIFLQHVFGQETAPDWCEGPDWSDKSLGRVRRLLAMDDAGRFG
jgi:hypothetical protein